MGIGDIIREHRAGRNESQEDLAEKLTKYNIYCDRTKISRVETNNDAEPELLFAIGKIYGCDVIQCYALGSPLKPVIDLRI